VKPFETISLEIEARGVARLTLDRPDKHNAMNAAMLSELTDAAQVVAARSDVRVLVLASKGKNFCAGADLGWMREQADASRDGRMAEARRIAGMLETFDTLPKLLIAEVQGHAYGGGVGLIAVSDIAIASDAATFVLSETRLGLVPATISPFVHRRIGTAAFRRIGLNARSFDASAGRAMGLLSDICPLADLPGRVEAEINAALACAPGAIAETKRLIRALAFGERPDTIQLLGSRWETEETRQGIAAFFSREKAPWSR
jgi:methylglutaconyl-CoA hydratase